MNILVVAVHPDDETLGCGGALLRWRQQGAHLHWLLVTSAHEPDFTRAQVERQRQEVEQVCHAYPFDALHWLKLPTTRLDTVPLGDLINLLRDVVQKVQPEIVLVPNRSDVHSDHRVTWAAMQAVLKSFCMKKLGVRRLLACEVLSETDAAPALAEQAFQPNCFVDISSVLDRKLEIMALFASQMQEEPLPRTLSAIRALARLRGSSVGVDYAESFMIIRELL